MIWSIRADASLQSRVAAPLSISGTAARVLHRFPPSQSSLYPRCPIYETFHLKCPGCGATRALAALLQGHFGEAMHLNALATIVLPVAAAYGLYWYWHFLRGERCRRMPVPQEAIYAALAAMSLFTVLRNLPLRPLQ